VNKADLVLLVVCAIWGTTFSLLRDSLRSIHPAELMALRFTMGTIVLLAAFPRRVFPLRRESLQRGGVIGIFLASGYLTQIIGLATITAARSAFLTSTYILFTPFLAIPLVGEVPRLAGLQPLYVARQLFDMRYGSSAGKAAALMKAVVTNLTEDDIIAISAYVASLPPQ